jgi:hypothetical protein
MEELFQVTYQLRWRPDSTLEHRVRRIITDEEGNMLRLDEWSPWLVVPLVPEEGELEP